MAVLETIRNKFGILITVLIAVALLSFIIDPSSLLSVISQNQGNNEDITVLEVNGHAVSYYDFNNEVQLIDNGNSNRNMLNSQVYVKYILKYLYEENAKAAGFNVTEKELAEVLSGNITSDIVKSYLGPGMTKSKLAEIEKNVESDESGRTKNQWNNTVSIVRSGRYLEKYTDYLDRSYFANSLLVEDDMKNSSTVFNVEFVCVPFEGLDDRSNIEVTEAEMMQYYESHKNHYKSGITRDIDYIFVELDSTRTEDMAKDVDKLFAEIQNLDDMKKVAEENGYDLCSLRLPYEVKEFDHEGNEILSNNENVVKWALKESETGVVSKPFYLTRENNSYMALAILTGANDTGFKPFEEVASDIETKIFYNKAKDELLAEVTDKVKGLNNLDEVSEVLGYNAVKKELVSFENAEAEKMRFVGAASVAAEGVLNAPFKGDDGIYVYVVTNREEKEFYDDKDIKEKFKFNKEYYEFKYSYYYKPVLPGIEDPGYVKNYTFLYF